MATTCSGWEMPRGCRKSPFITLKMAVLAPMPRASVSTAMAAKPGDLASMRNA